ncbi:MAG: hypothetical protein IT538_11625, partial [Variibacter sp.]|nr:hypothetical protein [Variibacter sp.]
TVLPPFLLAAAALGLHGLAATAKILGVALALYCLAMAPWWVRNYSELGVFVPFTTSAPINLYMGNSPRNPAVASYEPHLPADWAVDETGRDMRAIANELERAQAFRDRALAYIAADPAGFVRRAAIKFLTFWNLFPNAALYQSPVYRLVGLLSFAPVLLLAIASFFLARTSLLLLLPFLLLALYMTALHVVTIASIRYRLPLEPLMIALAGAPLAALSRRFPVTSLPFGLSAR